MVGIDYANTLKGDPRILLAGQAIRRTGAADSQHGRLTSSQERHHKTEEAV